jgi:hypothetical protein
LALRGAAREDLIKEPGTRSSRRKLLNFPSRPPTRPSNVVVRNTKKAKTNLLVLISNSCQTAPTRLMPGEASARRSYETLARRKQAIRIVWEISAFYRIIRTMPESRALCRNNLAANVALCHWSPRGTHLFIRQRRDRFSAPAQPDRPHPESDAIACREQHFKRKGRSGYQYLIHVFTLKG